MKRLRIALGIITLLSGCGQQPSQDLQKDQVFSKQFPSKSLSLASDSGNRYELSPRQGSSPGHGFVSVPIGNCGNTWDPFVFAQSGCLQNDPFAYWTNYSNAIHAWNPGYNRTVNMTLGGNQFDQWQWQGQPTCYSLRITSSSQVIDVVRFDAYDGIHNNAVSGSGTNTVSVQAQFSYPGTLIFALRDPSNGWWNSSPCGQQQGGWDQPWWGFNYQFPTCGAPQAQSSVQITGSAGPCGAPVAVNFDLSPYLNTQYGLPQTGGSNWNYRYSMPYFQTANGYIRGRVMEYAGQYNFNQWNWIQ